MATEFSTSDPTLVPNNGGEPEEDEEHWLYGDETKKQSGENVAGFPDANQESYLSNTNEKQAADKAAKSGEDDDNDESDSDDDDDVKVTIGNIKTGAPSYMAPPMNLSLKSGRGYGVTAPAKLQSKGIDMEAVGSINGLPVVEVDIDIFEDKPWRKPGADLSDYFNYGFNEETWKAYCEKQRRLQLGLEPGVPQNSENKITVQQGRSAVLEKEIESAAIKTEFKMDFIPPANILPAASRLKAGPPPNRKLGGTIDVIGGQTGAIRRVEGRRREIHEHNPIQVLGDHAGKTPPFVPPAGLPPPPIGAPPPHFLHPPPPVSGMPPPLHPPVFWLRLVALITIAGLCSQVSPPQPYQVGLCGNSRRPFSCSLVITYEHAAHHRVLCYRLIPASFGSAPYSNDAPDGWEVPHHRVHHQSSSPLWVQLWRFHLHQLPSCLCLTLSMGHAYGEGRRGHVTLGVPGLSTGPGERAGAREGPDSHHQRVQQRG
ncbi:pre-mRNA 3'-end-processing factor FIP1-like isoform X1 [Brienomyrus brachyistius]|uniref:pre-mRNA 3'-end-processing factor FIP1-like isoform X1 n=1 Tax=Brienomyrus brachyistius TaxID=42636 RepID=UPI0020B3D4AF|nr:pre-mRNA 3'-end-processing factor FIP1-like isoform X1 [Brienomyrus brachyistius]